MAETDPFVTTVGAQLCAKSIRYERPKVKGGAIAPPLWLLDLGVVRSWSGPRTWDLCFGKDRACLEDPEDVTRTICAEAIVARRLERAGYTAGWLSAYRAPPPANWTPRMAFSSAQDLWTGHGYPRKPPDRLEHVVLVAIHVPDRSGVDDLEPRHE